MRQLFAMQLITVRTTECQTAIDIQTMLFTLIILHYSCKPITTKEICFNSTQMMSQYQYLKKDRQKFQLPIVCNSRGLCWESTGILARKELNWYHNIVSVNNVHDEMFNRIPLFSYN